MIALEINLLLVFSPCNFWSIGILILTMSNLNNKKILLIICGGIAAYKSLEIIRLLKKGNYKTILTKSGAEFVTPLSITSLSQSKVYQDLFNLENETEMDHISLSRWADLILIAPATANTISKLANEILMIWHLQLRLLQTKKFLLLLQ